MNFKLTPTLSLEKRGRTAKPKVLMALSGGIDSAVSAYLLIKQGYEVEAAFMKNWSSTAGLLRNECPWLKDRQDALRVAAFLRIPMHTLDFEKQYQKTVMDYFFKEYRAGRTPNPDVMCNKEIKFKLLYNWAMKNGFDYLATGHYARISQSANQPVSKSAKPERSVPIYRPDVGAASGRPKKGKPMASPTLERSADEFKDQTYFIYNIKPEQLAHVLFPIGGMKKPQVRALAKKIGLPNADKRESMGLCFVGKIRLKDFLQQKLKAKKGPIIVLQTSVGTLTPPNLPFRKGEGTPSFLKRGQGELVVGHHLGLHNYTIGQRQGIKVGGQGPYFVVRKDLKNNTLYVTNDPYDERLMVKEIEIHSMNWISPSYNKRGQGGDIDIIKGLTGRYRHQGELVPLTLENIGKNHYKVTFKHPQKAIASGQSLVLYKDRECIGGGVIA